MAFATQCIHKGCNKQMEPYIDPKSDKVYCSVCDKELTNMTHFTKVQLKTLKQYKQKSTTSFSTKCVSCNKEARPIILQDKVCCPQCKKEHSHLTTHYKFMLKKTLSTLRRFVKIISDACKFLLNNYPEAKSTKDYLNSRLLESTQEVFDFGYFPDIKNFKSLTNLIGETMLIDNKLLYFKIIEDSHSPRRLAFPFFENYQVILPFKDAYR